jgi:hypothetical protein
LRADARKFCLHLRLRISRVHAERFFRYRTNFPITKKNTGMTVPVFLYAPMSKEKRSLLTSGTGGQNKPADRIAVGLGLQTDSSYYN